MLEAALASLENAMRGVQVVNRSLRGLVEHHQNELASLL